MMKVSIIIVNYNTLELTKNTINSVIEKTKNLKYEIILVDNASVDGSVEFFEKEYKNKIIFIKNNENLGFGKANNKGIEIARGKYVFLLNPDTLLINNAIKILFDFMENNENCGVCGGNLYDLDMRPMSSFDKKMITYKSLYIKDIIKEIKFRISKKIKRIVKYDNFNYSDKPCEVKIIIGADMMIRKKVLEKIGFFDEDFFMYHEESELCFRVLKNNFKIYSVPKAKIIHLEGQSSKVKENKFKLDRNGLYLFFYKTSNKDLKTVRKAYIRLQLKYLTIFNFKKFSWNKDVYKNFIKQKRGN